MRTSCRNARARWSPRSPKPWDSSGSVIMRAVQDHVDFDWGGTFSSRRCECNACDVGNRAGHAIRARRIIGELFAALTPPVAHDALLTDVYAFDDIMRGRNADPPTTEHTHDIVAMPIRPSAPNAL